MTCLICTNSSAVDRVDAARNAILKQMAAHGFVACNLSTLRATFMPFRAICKKFSRCDEATVEKRERWAQGLQR